MAVCPAVIALAVTVAAAAAPDGALQSVGARGGLALSCLIGENAACTEDGVLVRQIDSQLAGRESAASFQNRITMIELPAAAPRS